MENKKKAVVSALKKTIKKTAKPKVLKKTPKVNDKTRQEIEKLFASGFGCDCSCCAHHCGAKK